MGFVTVIGWGLVLLQILALSPLEVSFTLLLLIVFLGICEYYPMPVPKGHTTLTFPIIYMIYVVFGLETVIIIYAFIVLAINLTHRRPLRIMLFNPSQLAISFYLAHVLHQIMMETFLTVTISPLLNGLIGFSLMIILFYILNNVIVDIVLWLRPEPYTLKIWWGKTHGELISFVISYIYGCLIHILGSQNRGEVDIFSFFFFFSPLVGLSLLSSIIARLKTEKNRIRALFQFSTELNKSIPSRGWEKLIKNLLQELMPFEDCILFVKNEKGIWDQTIIKGEILSDLPLDALLELEKISHLQGYDHKKSGKGPLAPFLRASSRSVVYAPLLFEGQSIGCFVVSKGRTKSFTIEDTRSIATIANQLAVFLKTRQLVSEQERRIILEERNRIAHDIHDGIAQTLAGAVMKLDISYKKLETHPSDAKLLIADSIKKLRESLKDVRDSIYALRPYPTEELGFHLAVEKKLTELKKDPTFTLDVQLQVRGNRGSISPMTEKVMFSVFQESIQNCLKHANATHLHILISYQSDHIVLKMRDNGRGFSLYHAMIKAMNQPHYGILQMNEAAEKIGAALQIDSKPNEGTEITLTVPKLGLEGEIDND
ncbi:histidine kinase [Bacillus tianshenii]|uniref:GAF domain-containing sensor histidine kinase n=1 Tax=Sutcliffiella tianshenii TaxID=1463404 RepID=UPI001CD381F4|nr:GAF domain-containing sensor histidine kinase [Bacillus tianshenii]MCA1319188.1 histidine kinase [Bacillus tianshenii]